MSERMSWEEIREKYPDQWVGLVDIDWKNSANVRSAYWTDGISGNCGVK